MEISKETKKIVFDCTCINDFYLQSLDLITFHAPFT